MKGAVEWCSGAAVDLHGLDRVATIVARTRRAPATVLDRMHLGDACDAQAPHRDEFVRTEVRYAPESDRQSLLRHRFAGAVPHVGV